MLAERAGLTEREATALLDAGGRYLRQLASVNESAESEIKARRDRLTPQELYAQARARAVATSSDGTGTYRIDIAPVLRASLEADGVVTRIERQRGAAYAAHRETLRQALGAEKLAAIDVLVATEVAPNIVMVALPSIEVEPKVDLSSAESVPGRLR